MMKLYIMDHLLTKLCKICTFYKYIRTKYCFVVMKDVILYNFTQNESFSCLAYVCGFHPYE